MYELADWGRPAPAEWNEPRERLDLRLPPSLVRVLRARALLEGRFHATTADVKAVAHPVLRHRLITTFQADSENISSDAIIDMLLERVPVDLYRRADELAQGLTK